MIWIRFSDESRSATGCDGPSLTRGSERTRKLQFTGICEGEPHIDIEQIGHGAPSALR